jgi:DNA-binding IscR family transcriptional regulator
MQITRQADYAVRAVLYLARLGEQRAATSAVAKDQNIPPSFLAKIISQLSIAGLVHTSQRTRSRCDPGPHAQGDLPAGSGGSHRWTHPAQRVRAGRRTLHLRQNCPLRPIWCEAQNDLVTRLKRTDFGSLLS